MLIHVRATPDQIFLQTGGCAVFGNDLNSGRVEAEDVHHVSEGVSNGCAA